MAAPKTQDIVAKLWNLCNVLKDDGVTYHQYVNELTYLLFLKMAQETKTETQIPSGYRWADLTSREGAPLLEHYRLLLIYLGGHGARTRPGHLQQRGHLNPGAAPPPQTRHRHQRTRLVLRPSGRPR
jgi:hypothetical protein